MEQLSTHGARGAANSSCVGTDVPGGEREERVVDRAWNRIAPALQFENMKAPCRLGHRVFIPARSSAPPPHAAVQSAAMVTLLTETKTLLPPDHCVVEMWLGDHLFAAPEHDGHVSILSGQYKVCLR